MNIFVLFGIYVFEFFFCIFGLKFAFTLCDFNVCNVLIVNSVYCEFFHFMASRHWNMPKLCFQVR